VTSSWSLILQLPQRCTVQYTLDKLLSTYKKYEFDIIPVLFVTTRRNLSQYGQKSLYLNSTPTILLLFTINYPNTAATQLVS